MLSLGQQKVDMGIVCVTSIALVSDYFFFSFKLFQKYIVLESLLSRAGLNGRELLSSEIFWMALELVTKELTSAQSLTCFGSPFIRQLLLIFISLQRSWMNFLGVCMEQNIICFYLFCIQIKYPFQPLLMPKLGQIKSSLDEQIELVIKIVKGLKKQKQKISPNSRFMIGICGIPGSGKSTVSLRLSKELQNSVVLPMDGFHLRRNQLTEEGLVRRGAAFTFDLLQFQNKMNQIKKSPLGERLKYPSFSHEQKDPVEDAIQITPNTDIIIVEGLYTFDKNLQLNKLQEQKSQSTHSFWDFKIWVESGIQEAIERVAKRHLQSGIEPNYELAYKRANSNDRTNAIYVQGNCFQAGQFMSAGNFQMNHIGLGVVLYNSQQSV